MTYIHSLLGRAPRRACQQKRAGWRPKPWTRRQAEKVRKRSVQDGFASFGEHTPSFFFGNGTENVNMSMKVFVQDKTLVEGRRRRNKVGMSDVLDGDWKHERGGSSHGPTQQKSNRKGDQDQVYPSSDTGYPNDASFLISPRPSSKEGKDK